MIEATACDRIMLRVLYNGTTKDLFVTQDAIDHCGGIDWFKEFCEAYSLQMSDYDTERGGYPIRVTST